jgi:carboxyl-terminal processing protease
METSQRRSRLLIGAITVLVLGAAGGAIFGERSIPEDETELVLRASQIVRNLLEWLPEEHEASDLIYDGIGGMLEVLDPHSNYLDPRSFQRMRTRQEGSFFGVGIIISRRDGQVTVIAPMAGTPAASQGLRTGDVITAVEGQSTEEITLDEVVDLVRGPEGTTVRLTIRRPGMDEPFDVDITRARIPQNSVRFAFMMDDAIGYIRLSEFSNTSVREVDEAIQELTDQGMTRLVFDLRTNPGGPLDAAVGVSDSFLHEGQLIVSTRGRTPESNSTFSAPGKGERFHGPLIVLVNEGSASASEIVAGAVQDHDRGLVLGEVTWGKGLVQTVFSVRDTGLALTTARYFTPAGRSIQRNYDSFIDYITHRNGVVATDPAATTYETEAGRTVLGGGGITPDVEVIGRSFADPVVRLYGQAAFFGHAVELLKDVPEADKIAFAEAFQADQENIDEFLEWAVRGEMLSSEDLALLREDQQAIEDVGRGLHVEILNATLGLEAGYRLAIEADNQLAEALGHFDVAEDMWEVWQANGKAGGES